MADSKPKPTSLTNDDYKRPEKTYTETLTEDDIPYEKRIAMMKVSDNTNIHFKKLQTLSFQI